MRIFLFIMFLFVLDGSAFCQYSYDYGILKAKITDVKYDNSYYRYLMKSMNSAMKWYWSNDSVYLEILNPSIFESPATLIDLKNKKATKYFADKTFLIENFDPSKVLDPMLPKELSSLKILEYPGNNYSYMGMSCRDMIVGNKDVKVRLTLTRDINVAKELRYSKNHKDSLLNILADNFVIQSLMKTKMGEFTIGVTNLNRKPNPIIDHLPDTKFWRQIDFEFSDSKKEKPEAFEGKNNNTIKELIEEGILENSDFYSALFNSENVDKYLIIFRAMKRADFNFDSTRIILQKYNLLDTIQFKELDNFVENNPITNIDLARGLIRNLFIRSALFNTDSRKVLADNISSVPYLGKIDLNKKNEFIAGKKSFVEFFESFENIVPLNYIKGKFSLEEASMIADSFFNKYYIAGKVKSNFDINDQLKNIYFESEGEKIYVKSHEFNFVYSEEKDSYVYDSIRVDINFYKTLIKVINTISCHFNNDDFYHIGNYYSNFIVSENYDDDFIQTYPNSNPFPDTYYLLKYRYDSDILKLNQVPVLIPISSAANKFNHLNFYIINDLKFDCNYVQNNYYNAVRFIEKYKNEIFDNEQSYLKTREGLDASYLNENSDLIKYLGIKNKTFDCNYFNVQAVKTGVFSKDFPELFKFCGKKFEAKNIKFDVKNKLLSMTKGSENMTIEMDGKCMLKTMCGVINSQLDETGYCIYSEFSLTSKVMVYFLSLQQKRELERLIGIQLNPIHY